MRHLQPSWRPWPPPWPGPRRTLACHSAPLITAVAGSVQISKLDSSAGSTSMRTRPVDRDDVRGLPAGGLEVALRSVRDAPHVVPHALHVRMAVAGVRDREDGVRLAEPGVREVRRGEEHLHPSDAVRDLRAQ